MWLIDKLMYKTLVETKLKIAFEITPYLRLKMVWVASLGKKISSYSSTYIGEISTTRYLFYPYWIGQVMFRSSHFSFLVFCHFWRRSYKNRNSYIIFVYILQCKMGKMKKMKENLANKVTKNQKTKIWDEQNISYL